MLFSAAAVAAAAVKRTSMQHTCRVCGKNYINEGSLRKHLQSHTTNVSQNLRMWPCSVCHAVFTQETGLITHMDHMRLDQKHQFAGQFMLSKTIVERQSSLRPTRDSNEENTSHDDILNSGVCGDLNNNISNSPLSEIDFSFRSEVIHPDRNKNCDSKKENNLHTQVF